VVVIIVERAPPSLRGDLTRWMLEPQAGVFVGTVSALVRDKLWERVCQGVKGGAATLIHSSDGEQGFGVRLWGAATRSMEDFEGLWLVRVPENQRLR
jgi:CRISPR-associated protein Cas2